MRMVVHLCTLTRYRSRRNQQRSSTWPTAKVSDATGLANRTVSFLPEAAKRPRVLGCPLDRAHAGDRLGIAGDVAGGSAFLPRRSRPVPPPSAASGEKADPPKKDAEIEALRKEYRRSKRSQSNKPNAPAHSPNTPPLNGNYPRCFSARSSSSPASSTASGSPHRFRRSMLCR